MSAKSKSLAKSLHTVTALASVARAVLAYEPGITKGDAMQRALAILGYDGAADEYGLAAKALATKALATL